MSWVGAGEARGAQQAALRQSGCRPRRHVRACLRKWPDGEVPEKIRKQGAELVEPYALLLLLAALARRAS